MIIAQKVTDNFSAYHCDCVEGVGLLPDNSVGYSIFSPPFASLYTYSASDRDMGNCTSHDTFFEQFQFLVKELYRVTKPGRLLSFHCMNLPTSKTHDGYIGIQDFRGELIRAFQGNEASDLQKAISRLQLRQQEAIANKDFERMERLQKSIFTIQQDMKECPSESEFIYHSEVTIWKDPVTAMQRTKAIGLLHKQVVKDSCMSRQGIPDYLVTMRKPGVNESPVIGEFDEYFGDGTQGIGFPTGTATRYSIEVWQRYASPVWMDINPSDTLQYRSAREHNDERHVCPLQLQVIERGLALWSNPGDVVLSPFMGIGSEGYVSIEHGRKFIGFELKESYFNQACANLAAAESKRNEQDLFSTIS